MPIGHIPVLLREVEEVLAPKPGDTFIDGTLGLGGHTEMLLHRSAPTGRVLGIDRDPRNVAQARERLAAFEPRAVLIQGNYRNMVALAQEHGFAAVQGVLLDVGFSSLHVDDASRGFSFLHDGPLDMRYDPAGELTAAQIVNTWAPAELERILRLYGEERRTERIVKAIVDARRRTLFTTTLELATCIAGAAPRHGRLHPATQTFQALRIAVNDELGALEEGLKAGWECLGSGGVLAVISFHSLEDRLVKHFMRGLGVAGEILTKRPTEAGAEEARNNPRARSAKLRAMRKH
jgi:16S rRNA (cytosine1402-N4)-methyltransferase